MNTLMTIVSNLPIVGNKQPAAFSLLSICLPLILLPLLNSGKAKEQQSDK